MNSLEKTKEIAIKYFTLYFGEEHREKIERRINNINLYFTDKYTPPNKYSMEITNKHLEYARTIPNASINEQQLFMNSVLNAERWFNYVNSGYAGYNYNFSLWPAAGKKVLGYETCKERLDSAPWIVIINKMTGDPMNAKLLDSKIVHEFLHTVIDRITEDFEAFNGVKNSDTNYGTALNEWLVEEMAVDITQAMYKDGVSISGLINPNEEIDYKSAYLSNRVFMPDNSFDMIKDSAKAAMMDGDLERLQNNMGGPESYNDIVNIFEDFSRIYHALFYISIGNEKGFADKNELNQLKQDIAGVKAYIGETIVKPCV